MGKIGIMLPVEDEEINNILSSLKLDKVDNLSPHITLYTLEIKKSGINKIKEEIPKILNLKIKIIDAKKTDYGVLRLRLKNNKDLFELHKMIVKNVSKYYDKKAPSKVKQFYDKFSDEERELVKKYGRANVMQNFKPHITLGKTENNAEIKISKEIYLDKIRVYYDRGNGWEEI